MKQFFKKHWITLSCMAGFLLFQGLIRLVIFLEDSGICCEIPIHSQLLPALSQKFPAFSQSY